MDYRLVCLVGKGSFGEIFLGEHKTKANNKFSSAAIKIIDLENSDIKDSYNLLLTEIQILVKNKCKYLLQCNGITITKIRGKYKLRLVLPYYPNGDLAAEITRRRDKSCYYYQDTIVKYFNQITLGLDYLHYNNIIHRDLKPSNILITNNYNLKVCDFNTSKILTDTNFVKSNMHTQIGTPFYMSPECIDNSKYNFKTDIWSLGCILFELMELSIAFETNHIGKLIIKIHNASYNKFSKRNMYTNELKKLVKDCIQKDAEKRPSTSDILDMLLFSNSRFDKYNEKEINTIQSSLMPKSSIEFKKILKKFYQPLIENKIDSTKSLCVSKMKISPKEKQ